MLIWSQILPRLNWRYSNNLAVMDKCRRRLNSSIGAHITRNGGCYIRYPDFKAIHQFISTDVIFLNTIQGGLESIILSNTGGVTYPNDYVEYLIDHLKEL